MALEQDSQASRTKGLAIIAGALVLAGLAMSIPVAMALDALSPAIRLGWPVPVVDRIDQVSVQEALIKAGFWLVPVALVAAIAGVASGVQARKIGLPALLIGIAGFALAAAVAFGFGSAISK
jgi:hypothetical protein